MNNCFEEANIKVTGFLLFVITIQLNIKATKSLLFVTIRLSGVQLFRVNKQVISIIVVTRVIIRVIGITVVTMKGQSAVVRAIILITYLSKI